jgi:hypothetical protein
MKTNCNTHIYLYAKGHYKRNDVIEDLRILVAERCGQYNECSKEGRVSKNDVCIVLTHIIRPYVIKNSHYLFDELLNDISPENSWKVGYRNRQSSYPNLIGDMRIVDLPEYDYWTALIYKSLSILRMLKLKEILEIEGAPLGEPDYELFPMLKLNKKEKEQCY